MENHKLQNEFEEAIQKIVTQVSEEVYLKDLKQIHVSYKECLKGLEKQTGKLMDSADLLKDQRMATALDLNSMKKEMEENTQRMETALTGFYQSYESLLRQYEESMMKLSGSIATEESIGNLTKELEQVRETVKNTGDLKYLEKMTDFEKVLKNATSEEKKAMEDTVREVFWTENEKTKLVLQEFQKSLMEITQNVMSKKEMAEFHEKLAEYTAGICGIADRRYEEVLKAFEEKLFQMGTMQFSNYVRVLNESALKVTDLEIFLRQVKLLEESMRQVVRKSEEEYKQIFYGYRTEVQKVNKEDREGFLEELTGLFGQQYERMKKSMEHHIEVIEQFREEQAELAQCIQLIHQLVQKNNSNIKLISRIVTDLSRQQEFMTEKLNLAVDAMEDNSRQMEDVMGFVKEGNQRLQEGIRQLEKQEEVLEDVAKRNKESVEGIKKVTEELQVQNTDLGKQMKEIGREVREQTRLLKALIGEGSEWKVDLFGRFEINLVYLVIVMLLWICFKVM